MCPRCRAEYEDPDDRRFVEPGFLERTIAGQRRALADLIRLQLYGFSWAATSSPSWPLLAVTT